MQRDWRAFYANGSAPTTPSAFCEFVLGRRIPGKTLVDVGCGNGRDSERLAERYSVLGVDPYAPDRPGLRARYLQKTLDEAWEHLRSADVVYNRFFLHYVVPETIAALFRAAPGCVCTEARALGDRPVVYPEHERRYVDNLALIQTALDAGHEVLYFELGHGLAVYRNEDPLVLRLITRNRLSPSRYPYSE